VRWFAFSGVETPSAMARGLLGAKAPLSVRVVLITNGNLLFMALGLPRMILCPVFERPPLHLSLWYKLRGAGRQFLQLILSSSPLHKNHNTSLCLPRARRSKLYQLVKDGSWR
jgi:hypothetical protein